MINSHASVLLFGLIVLAMSSCLGQNRSLKKTGAAARDSEKESAVKKPSHKTDSLPANDEFWNLAMKRYDPVGLNDAIKASVESSSSGLSVPGDGTAREHNASVSSPGAAMVDSSSNPGPQQDLSKAPFATRAQGRRGMVTSPFDPAGRLVDVRDLDAGQMARCPYTGKVFRVPP